MPKIAYVHKSFRTASRVIIDQANSIIDEYNEQGYSLTLRQLYYQFVARGLIENSIRSYKNLGGTINDARLAGLIDWYAIEDRTRNLISLAHWDSPRDIVEACASQFRYDKWENQPYRVEVWVEKEALTGVIARACNRWDVPYFACRGYVSASEQWRAARRFIGYNEQDQKVIMLHLGDHDPSGVDMTRDNNDRLRTFAAEIDLTRIALNMDQISQYGPPPNPAKLTDTRARDYIAKYGMESWELDALEPSVIDDLIENHITQYVDQSIWDDDVRRETEARARIKEVAGEL